MFSFWHANTQPATVSDSGIVEVKFRQQQRVEMMHRLDEKLKELDQRILV